MDAPFPPETDGRLAIHPNEQEETHLLVTDYQSCLAREEEEDGMGEEEGTNKRDMSFVKQ